MIHLAIVLQRIITHVTTLGGTLLGPATLHDTERKPSQGSINSVADPETGLLVLNADDWGRDRANTDRILECFLIGTLSSASAMVFMEDSERAATLARENNLDAGLHINLSSSFTGSGTSSQLREHQARVRRYLKGHRFAQVVYHPGLSNSFGYLVNKQIEEYQRLYGCPPQRLDGHHHMHLCANVLLGKLLPVGTLVRPSFSFYAGEKGTGNRVYRAMVNGLLSRRHRSADYFFSLAPLQPPERLQRIFALASAATVEVETHPVNDDEYHFLTDGSIQRLLGDVKIANSFAPRQVGTDAPDRPVKDRFACFLPYLFAFGAALYESLAQLSECC